MCVTASEVEVERLRDDSDQVARNDEDMKPKKQGCRTNDVTH
jgi:hypothetical protein